MQVRLGCLRDLEDISSVNHGNQYHFLFVIFKFSKLAQNRLISDSSSVVRLPVNHLTFPGDESHDIKGEYGGDTNTVQ